MTQRNSCAILVLGDIGRSPRMQYHAISLSRQAQMDVDIVCFLETRPREEVMSDPHIRIHNLSAFPLKPPSSRLIYLFYGVIKAIFQFFALMYMLLYTIPKPQFILVQTPPAIPSLFVAWISSKLRRHAFVIDWHNYAYSLMALSLGQNHPLVRLSYFIEGFFGRRSDAHFSVTHTMLADLATRWNIRGAGRALHD